MNKIPVRYPLLDFLRGLAVLLMIVFHFFYDLTILQHINIDFHENLFWFSFPRAIAALFLLCVGMGQTIGHRTEIHWKKYGKRFVHLGIIALLISFFTYTLFPFNWSYFEAIHRIARVSLIIPFLVPYPVTSLIIGTCLVASYWFLPIPSFPPLVEDIQSMDFIPLYPWLGVSLWGIYFGNKEIYKIKIPEHPAFKGLIFMGKHSLIIYLVHQPLMYGMLRLISSVVK